MQLYNHTPDCATSPGAILAEIIEHLNVTERELALRTELPIPTATDILAGVSAVTPAIADKLEAATSVHARIWTNIENQYRAHLSKVTENEKRRLGTGVRHKYASCNLLGHRRVRGKIPFGVQNDIL